MRKRKPSRLGDVHRLVFFGTCLPFDALCFASVQAKGWDSGAQYPKYSLDADRDKFKIIHAGGTGAMQALGNRLSQDEILKIIAHINSPKEE